MNITNINERQFDKTLQREGQEITDFYSGKKYKVFFRRPSKGNATAKLNLFYSQDTDISIGTVFTYKDNSYVVISQDAYESNVYYNSIAMKSEVAFSVKHNGTWYQVPFVLASDKYTINENKTISVISGSIAVYSGLNDIVKEMIPNKSYNVFGGTYKIGNFFYNENMAYIYMTREADSDVNQYELRYDGLTSISSDESTYQLPYTAIINGVESPNPTITYTSSDNTIATVDNTGLLTMLKGGTVVITATWTERNVSVQTSINISAVVQPTSNITATAFEVAAGSKYGRNFVGYFYDASGTEVTGVTPVWTITDCNFQSDLTITYPRSMTVNIATTNINLIDKTFTLNLSDANNIYVPTAKSILITSIYG